VSRGPGPLAVAIYAELDRPGRNWATVTALATDVYGEGDRAWRTARAKDVRRALRSMSKRGMVLLRQGDGQRLEAMRLEPSRRAKREI
jgi:hypothetical protein